VLVKAEELPAAPSSLPPENLDSDGVRVTALNTKKERSVLIYNRDVFAFEFVVLIIMPVINVYKILDPDPDSEQFCLV
jgi:hypothetical protein